MSQELYATSTAAMTIYNVLFEVGPKSKKDLFGLVCKTHLPGLDQKCFMRAMAECIKRGYFVDLGAKVKLADSQRRPVVSRHREDFAYTETGEVLGGWTQWQVKDPTRGLIPIEEVIK